jgi:hypothetical protein
MRILKTLDRGEDALVIDAVASQSEIRPADVAYATFLREELPSIFRGLLEEIVRSQVEEISERIKNHVVGVFDSAQKIAYRRFHQENSTSERARSGEGSSAAAERLHRQERADSLEGDTSVSTESKELELKADIVDLADGPIRSFSEGSSSFEPFEGQPLEKFRQSGALVIQGSLPLNNSLSKTITTAEMERHASLLMPDVTNLPHVFRGMEAKDGVADVTRDPRLDERCAEVDMPELMIDIPSILGPAQFIDSTQFMDPAQVLDSTQFMDPAQFLDSTQHLDSIQFLDLTECPSSAQFLDSSQFLDFVPQVRSWTDIARPAVEDAVLNFMRVMDAEECVLPSAARAPSKQTRPLA